MDRENWEEEQQRLDREWYNMDEGYDEENNPFNSGSAEYLKKKEEALEKKAIKRISAQQGRRTRTMSCGSGIAC